MLEPEDETKAPKFNRAEQQQTISVSKYEIIELQYYLDEIRVSLDRLDVFVKQL